MKKFALGISKFSCKQLKISFYLSIFRGLPFIPFIDNLPSMNRKLDGPFIMPIVDKYKDMGTVVMGKVESGECRKGQNLLIMPNRVRIKFENNFKLRYGDVCININKNRFVVRTSAESYFYCKFVY